MHSYANCGHFSWAHHRSNLSVESVLGDFSGKRLGRPALGDKMLESAQEHGPTSLAFISASSPLSLAGSVRGERIHSEGYDKRTLYDSIMDSRYESQKTNLFEKTGHRDSVCSSDSTFFEEHSGNAATKPPRYRPIFGLSVASVHTLHKEDDTMISVRFHSSFDILI